MAFKFWTPSEINKTRKALEKFKSVPEASRYLEKVLDRPFTAIQAKLYELNKKGEKSKKSNKEVLLPKGFKLDITFKKATISENRIILYF